MPDMSDLADRIRTLRRQRGWSQETLAAKSHISLRTVARLEGVDGERPLQSTLVLLANALKVSLEYLEDGDEPNGDEAVA